MTERQGDAGRLKARALGNKGGGRVGGGPVGGIVVAMRIGEEGAELVTRGAIEITGQRHQAWKARHEVTAG